MNKLLKSSKNILLPLLLFFMFLFILPLKSFSIENPTAFDNNMFGIHILFPEELTEAAKLVNSSGGDWGYVTIPIQSGDKNIEKWQKFMNDAASLHLIPIIRLSTEEYYFQKGVWRKPDYYDIIDFANFLNSLSWPVKNRYVLLFNEINRFDEWGGENPDPQYYSDLVSFSNLAFKNLSDDFFLIMGAFDNASVNIDHKYINEFDFLQRMLEWNNEIFDKIDGYASHSYPNPGFTQAPNSFKRIGTSTYLFEYDFINSHAKTKKPAFITETGWNSNILSEDTVALYWRQAFENIWMEDGKKIAAVTPFLLSGGSQFSMFSFLKDGKPTLYYIEIKNIKKTGGKPSINSRTEPVIKSYEITPLRKFKNNYLTSWDLTINPLVKMYLQMILGLR